MASDALTLEILREIRDGVAGTNLRLDQTVERLDQTVERLDQTVERLDQTNVRLDQTVVRLDQTVVRLDQTVERLDGLDARMGRVEQGLTDLGGFMKEIALDMAKYERFHAHHIRVIEEDLGEVKARVRALEERER